MAGVVALASTALFALPFFDRFELLSIDLLFWLRHHAFGAQYAPQGSPTVVIAIDEETYRTPPFRDLPKVMWTKQLAKVLNATLEGGALVVGYDVIFPTSVEKYIKGFDKEFLVALRTGAKEGKVVLGKVQHQAKPITPFPGYSFAVGHQKNIRSVNLFDDGDGVIRRVPLTFEAEDLKTGRRVEPSMALELAARTFGRRPKVEGPGGIILGGYRVPGSSKNAMALNFDGGDGAIPTYSLADLYACAERGRKDYFRKHFGGKVVLVGTVLDVEDRKLTSKRFITGPEGINLPERCEFPVKAGMYEENLVRDAIPSVYIHATAVDNLLRQDALSELLPLGYALLCIPFAVFVAALTLALSPIRAGLGILAGAMLWGVAATVAFQANRIFPLLDALAAGGVAFAALLCYRVAFLERVKRGLNRFVPDTVRRLIEQSPDAAALSKAGRDVTVLFLDVEGYTRLAESLPREKLTGLIERYFSLYLLTIRGSRGDINETAGDGLMAIFQEGGPEEHAGSAVRAALEIRDKTIAANREAGGAHPPIVVNIGICSGVCDVGATKLAGTAGDRWTFTATGLVTNTAARLGAHATRGQIIIGPETANRVKERFRLKSLGPIALKNIAAPVDAWEVGAAEDGDRQ